MTKIYVTQFDYDRLIKLLDDKKPHDDFDKALLYELKRCEIVDQKSIPGDVITMNSHVLFTDESGEDLDYWLVFPEDAELPNNKISILSPVGCALLGYKVGETVTLHTPNKGRRNLVVKDVLSQPEREGKFTI
ncbi:MAG: nucleoside diphosphate kinase regulator [Candidatus Microsaccharimonas sp.]